jgi:hypothetical protein
MNEQAKPSGTMFGDCNRETADNYHGEILRYGKYRVISCHDGRVQW